MRWRSIEADVEREEKRNRLKKKKSTISTQREGETHKEYWNGERGIKRRAQRTAGEQRTHQIGELLGRRSRISRLWMLLLLHMNNFPVLHNDATRQVSSVLAAVLHIISYIDSCTVQCRCNTSWPAHRYIDRMAVSPVESKSCVSGNCCCCCLQNFDCRRTDRQWQQPTKVSSKWKMKITNTLQYRLFICIWPAIHWLVG